MKNTAAFFDIDGTIYRDSLMVEHFKKLIKYEVVDEKAWVDNTRDIFMTWDRRQGNYDDYLLNLCDLYVKSHKFKRYILILALGLNGIYHKVTKLYLSQAAQIF